MPSSVSSAGQRASPRRVTTVAGIPERASARAEAQDVLLAAAEHGMEGLGEEEDARSTLGVTKQRHADGQRRLPVRPRPRGWTSLTT